jgi:hypothetical protein
MEAAPGKPLKKSATISVICGFFNYVKKAMRGSKIIWRNF